MFQLEPHAFNLFHMVRFAVYLFISGIGLDNKQITSIGIGSDKAESVCP